MKKERNALSQKGETWNLVLLFLPLVGTSFSNYVFLFLEKLFLSRVSQQAMEVAVNATYVGQMFQMASISLVMMAQVYVGRWHGARSLNEIGPGIWQFIWFSFLSMLITVPGSLCYGMWYFQGTNIEGVAQNYFYILTGTNFIYPLGIALSSYFLGQGKTRLILFANLGEQVAKITLAYLLIFGADPWIPKMGILGGIVSEVVVHGIFCLFLGSIFLSKKHREISHSNRWKLQPILFWHCIQPGLYRSLNRIFNVLSWGTIAHLMVAKGGEHLLILSLGGSLSLFFIFLFEGIYQAQTIVISQHIGAKRYSLLSKSIRSGLLIVSCSLCIISIPFLSLCIPSFHLLFPNISLDSQSIQYLFFGIWLWILYFTFAAIPIGFMIALKDTKFYLYWGVISCITDYLLMYYFIEIIQIRASLFWVVLSCVQMIGIIPPYFWRMFMLRNRLVRNIPVPLNHVQ
jgi:MATE family multidrug resistance protein